MQYSLSMAEEEKKENVFERLTPVLLFGVVLLAFAVGILWQKVSNLEGGGGNTAGVVDEAQVPSDGKLTEDQVALIPEVTDEDHINGSKDAKVLLIEYSDLQCPYCSTFNPTTEQILEQYGDDVALVYRHFPLDTLHPRARVAAEASECVADLGGNDAFWSFIDQVFANQEENLTDEGLLAVAEDVGINGDDFTACIDEGKFADVVENDYQGGVTAGVNGTPGTFIVNQNGEAWLIPGALPLEGITPTIDQALGN
jgi:protein-disulfide isomerase